MSAGQWEVKTNTRPGDQHVRSVHTRTGWISRPDPRSRLTTEISLAQHERFAGTIDDLLDADFTITEKDARVLAAVGVGDRTIVIQLSLQPHVIGRRRFIAVRRIVSAKMSGARARSRE